MNTEAFTTRRRTTCTIGDTARNAVSSILFIPCAVIVMAYWLVGSLFPHPHDSDWDDLAN